MNSSEYLREFSFRGFLDLFFRQKTVIIITLCLVNTIVFFGLMLMTPVYEARVKMLISAEKQVQAPYYNELGGFGGSLVHMTQTIIVKSNPVVERSVRALKLDRRPLDYEKYFSHPLKTPIIELLAVKHQQKLDSSAPEEARDYLFWAAVEDLKDRLSVELIPNTNIFEIIVHDFSPKTAMEIANVVSRSYAIYDLQQQLAELTIRYGERHPSVQQLGDNIFHMNASLTGERLPDIEAIGTASVKIIEQATTDFKPSGKSKFLVLIVSGFASLFLGLSLAFVFDYLNQGFKAPQEMVNFLRIPILGYVPLIKDRQRHVLNSPIDNERNEEHYSDLADQIYIFMKTQNIITMQFIPTLQDSGTTSIIVRLGSIFAEHLNRRTLIVDANLRNPTIHKYFNFENHYGLGNLLEQKLIEYRNPLMINSEDGLRAPSHDSKFENPQHHDNMTNHAAFSENTREPASTPDQPKSSNDNIDDSFLYNALHHAGHNLYILSAGTLSGNPVILMENFLMDSILRVAKNRFEAVFIDSPNLSMFKDGAMLSSKVDGVALIIDESRDKRHVVKTSIDLLEQKKANILGFVLNKRTMAIPDFIYKRL